MKKVNLSILGFMANYWLFSDSHVENIQGEGDSAKVVSYVPSTKKGKTEGTIPLQVGAEDVTNSKGEVVWKAGEKYAINIAQIMPLIPAENWEDCPAPVVEAPKELTPEQKAKQAIKDERKKLTKAVTAAKDKIFAAPANVSDEDLRNMKLELQAATDALAAFNDEHSAEKKNVPQELTVEQQSLLDAYLAQEKVIADWLVIENTKLAELKTAAESGGVIFEKPKGDRATNFSGSYEKAQEIRKMYSEGKKASEIAEHFGCSGSLVMQYVNYQTYPLVKGDTAFTPLVNSVFTADVLPPTCTGYNENGRAVGNNYEGATAENGKWMSAEAREAAIADTSHKNNAAITEYWKTKKA